MWFWLVMIVVGVLMLVAALVEALFWWLTIVAVALIVGAAVAEAVVDWSHERALRRRGQETTPDRAPEAAPPIPMAEHDPGTTPVTAALCERL